MPRSTHDYTKRSDGWLVTQAGVLRHQRRTTASATEQAEIDTELRAIGAVLAHRDQARRSASLMHVGNAEGELRILLYEVFGQKAPGVGMDRIIAEADDLLARLRREWTPPRPGLLRRIVQVFR